jgi:hypothetical protein
MDTLLSSHAMNELSRWDRWVRWRDPHHVHCLDWDEWYGSGPFEVDHAAEGLPPGLVLKTRLGEREVNSVWLVAVSEHAGTAERVL